MLVCACERWWAELNSAKANSPFLTFFFTQLAPVVRRMDNAIHRINRYPVDRVIQLLNNWAQAFCYFDKQISLEERSQNFRSLVCNFFPARYYGSTCLYKWENLEHFRYRIQPITFVNSLVPRSFRHSHIVNPISKLTNFTVTWLLNDSEARGDLVLIQTAQFFFWGGGKGSFCYVN